ncbi:MAG: GC-type dockerin domain-anchored protein [Phycisphaerales bacterium JB039]
MNGMCVMSSLCVIACLPAGALGQCQEPTQILDIPEIHSLAMDGLLAVSTEREDRPYLRTYRRDGGAWSLTDGRYIQNRGPMAMSGNLLAIGRIRSDPRTVEVWRFGSDRWWFSGALSTPVPGIDYGTVVAASGDTVLVGDPIAEQIHFYTAGPGGWEQSATLEGPSAEHEDFGRALAIEGDVAAALTHTAWYESAILFYRRDGGAWSFDTELRIGIPYSSDIRLDGDRLIVSSRSPGGPGRIYRYDGAMWVHEARLEGERSADWLTARPVQLDGDLALVAGGHDAEIDVDGASYLYQRLPGGDWRRSRRLLASSRDIALDDNWAALRGRDAILLYDLTLPADPCPPPPPPDPDNGLLLSVDGLLSPQTPSVRVLAQGFFGPRDYALAASIFDVVASEPGWADPKLLLFGPGTSAGFVEGAEVVDVVLGQLHFPGEVEADPSNPIDIWTASFAAADFSPRLVTVQARTFGYFVYPDQGSSVSEPRILGIVDPEATIRVWRSSCLADCDGSGALDIFDFLCFQDLFSAGNLACDFDEDGMLTLFDFLAFQNEFAGGCP